MSSAFTAASHTSGPRLSTRLLAYGAQLALYSISGIARSTPSPQIAVHGVMGRGIAHPRHCHQNGAGRQRGAHSTHGGDASKRRRVAEHRDPSVRDDRARPGPLRLAELGRERAPARKGGLALLLLLHAVDAVNLYDVVRRPPPRRSAPSFFEVPASGGTLVQVPKLIYATAHKRHRTAELVKKAFAAGFRGVDTAHGERKRYNESAVGEALHGIFVQLKVHYTPGKMPGDGATRLRGAADELRLHRVGALLLRGPSEQARQTGKLTDDDVGAWRAAAVGEEGRRISLACATSSFATGRTAIGRA